VIVHVLRDLEHALIARHVGGQPDVRRVHVARLDVSRVVLEKAIGEDREHRRVLDRDADRVPVGVEEHRRIDR